MGLLKKKSILTNNVYVCACATFDDVSDMYEMKDMMSRITETAINSLMKSNDDFAKGLANATSKKGRIFPEIVKYQKDALADEALEEAKKNMRDFLSEKNVKDIKQENMYMTKGTLESSSYGTIDMSAAVYLDI